jgi:HEAT repeat protein
MRLAASALIAIVLVTLTASAQVPFEKVVADLGSPDPSVRFHAVRLLRDAGYPEGAAPLVPLLNDPLDEVQLEAISAELNIFLAEKGLSRRRVALIVEVRDRVDAEAVFAKGPFVLTADPVPMVVLRGLLGAMADANPEVGHDALYAFGVLSASPAATERHAVLAEALAPLLRMLNSRQGAAQTDVVRVIGRVYARQPGDPAVDQALGDALVNLLNAEGTTREAAMEALGVMRYERGVAALLDLATFYGRSELGVAGLGALARIAHPSATRRFLEELTDRDRERRRIAIEGLARLGYPERLRTSRRP